MKEYRKRDARRNRLVLTIGNFFFHITRDEARKLRNELQRFRLDPSTRKTRRGCK